MHVSWRKRWNDILSVYTQQAQKADKTGYDWVIDWELCKRLNFYRTTKLYTDSFWKDKNLLLTTLNEFWKIKIGFFISQKNNHGNWWFTVKCYECLSPETSCVFHSTTRFNLTILLMCNDSSSACCTCKRISQKVIPSLLLCFRTSETDVNGIVVEVKPSF